MTTTPVDALVQTIRDLRVLPDRRAAGQITSDQYTAEWRRLLALRTEQSQGMTPEQLREAAERASFAY